MIRRPRWRAAAGCCCGRCGWPWPRPTTLTGFRAWVVAECPVAPGRRARRPPAVPARRSCRPGACPAGPAAAGQQDPAVPGPGRRAARAALRSAGRGRVEDCTALAPQVGLNTGAARTALRTAVLAARDGGRREDRHPPGGDTDRGGFGKWAFAPGRRLPRHRVRHTRLRLHLRLHPGRGYATVLRAVAAVGPVRRVPPLAAHPPLAARLAADAPSPRAFGAARAGPSTGTGWRCRWKSTCC